MCAGLVMMSWHVRNAGFAVWLAGAHQSLNQSRLVHARESERLFPMCSYHPVRWALGDRFVTHAKTLEQ